MDDGLQTAPALAEDLRVSPKRLRQVIRDHHLVPDHQHRKHYRLDDNDVERIRSHPAVQALRRGRRLRSRESREP